MPPSSTSIAATNDRCCSGTANTSASASTSAFVWARQCLKEIFGSIRGYEIVETGVARRRGEFLKGFNRMPIKVEYR